MPDYLISLTVRAKDEATKPLGDIQHALGNMVAPGIVAGLATAAAGILSLTAAMKVGVAEAMEWQDGLAQLDAGLKSTAGVAGVTKQMILDLADTMQQETRFSDDAILSASNLALTFTNISKDIFPDVIKVAADMATGMKMDLNSALMSVAKAMQDPITGATALRRQGVMLTDTQEELIKKLVESGDAISAQKIVLAELNTEFAGRAVAAGKTFAGQLAIIDNTVKDLAQTLGDPLLPVLQEVAAELLTAFKDPALREAIRGLGQDIASMARDGIAGVKGLKAELGGLVTTIQQNQGAIVTGGEALVSAIAGAKLLGAVTALTVGLKAAGIFALPDLFALIALKAEVVGAALSGLSISGPWVLLTAAVFAAIKAVETYQTRQSALDKMAAIERGPLTPDMRAKLAERDALLAPSTSVATVTTSLGGMIDDLAIDFSQLSAPITDTNQELQRLATELSAAATKVTESMNAEDFARFNAMQARVAEHGAITATTTALQELATKSWLAAQATNENAMAAIRTNIALGAGDVGFGGGVAGGRSGPAAPVRSFAQQLQDFMLAGVGTSNALFTAQRFAKDNPTNKGAQDYYKSLLGGGGGGLDMDFASVIARAFPNIGAAQAWQGAFRSVQGREAGVQDVRDEQAGRLFKATYGREATKGEWEQRYYKGSFEGVDETGLDKLFGPNGTLITQQKEKAMADADAYKKMLDAMAAQLAKQGETIEAIRDLAKNRYYSP